MPGTKPSVAPPTVSQIGYGILVKCASRKSSPTAASTPSSTTSSDEANGTGTGAS